MDKKTNNTFGKQHIIPYFVTEVGTINLKFVNYINNLFEEKGLVIDDFGMGSAYNMPSYLLGEIEDNTDKAVVVSYYKEDDKPIPVILFDQHELMPLITRLETAEKDEDSFDIIRQVHKEIRG